MVNTDERRQILENARNNENLKKIKDMLRTGVEFLKHNRKGEVRAELLSQFLV